MGTPAAAPPAVSLVMRSKDEGWALQDTLAMLSRQADAGAIELIVIDSGSTDGSVEMIERAEPAAFKQIQPSEYVPGEVLNWGIEQASNECVLFLNADATPADERWLSELVSKLLESAEVGVAFSRQIPRPDCWGVFAHDYERCFGPQRESIRWDHFFSMVSCAVRKNVWEQCRFREDLQYAEDDEWSRRLKAQGHQIAFALESVVVHSHNYTLAQAYRRAFGDAKAIAATAVKGHAQSSLVSQTLGSLNDVRKDFSYLLKNRQLSAVPRALGTRAAQRWGAFKGFRDGWRHYGRDQQS